MQSPNPQGTRRLDDLDNYEVADGNPDPRGWEVRVSDDSRVGEVKELLVDPMAMKVRYLDVQLDSDEEQHVLLPIGIARLDDDGDYVRVEQSAADLLGMPRYEPGGELGRAYEDSILAGRYNVMTTEPADTSTEVTDETYYNRPEFDVDKFYGKRRTRQTNDDPAGGEPDMHRPG